MGCTMQNLLELALSDFIEFADKENIDSDDQVNLIVFFPCFEDLALDYKGDKFYIDSDIRF